MSSKDSGPVQFPTAPQGEPPSYDSIAPGAPPIMYPPVAPNPALRNMEYKGGSPGLQHLLQISQFSVMEKFIVSQEWNRNFEVLDQMGQRIYQAEQQIRCCQGLYNLKIRDNSGQDVMEVTEGCGCRCHSEMEVSSASESMGSAIVLSNLMITQLCITNSSREVVLIILGPTFQTSIFGNVTFEVKSKDGEYDVGIIKYENNRFMVSIPMDLDVTVKGLLMATCFYLVLMQILCRRGWWRRSVMWKSIIWKRKQKTVANVHCAIINNFMTQTPNLRTPLRKQAIPSSV
ncbi:phospholipid scramblase 2-like [Mixophyes fleayi]|uniref:phospholipid scramblase 2-like n=1 Tax=Mixophyes fleayi TaxID=3061075 RepID=UPI003F4E3F89